MSIGPRVGGDAIGAPQQPGYRELEASALNQNIKTMINITSEMKSADMPWLLLDFSKTKYHSTSNRPVLPPLEAMRSATPPPLGEDSSWKAIYGELLKLLSPTARYYFESNLQKPAEMRSEEFKAFDAVLQSSAKALVIFSGAAAPLESGGLSAMRATASRLLPYIAVGSAIPVSAALLGSARAILENIGPNMPNFDFYTNVLTQYNAIAADLQDSVAMLQEEGGAKAAHALLSKCCNNLEALSVTLDRYGGNAQLGILSDTTAAVKLAVEALLLSKPGASPLLIALETASTGFGTPGSALSPMGPTLHTLIGAVGKELSSHYLSGEGSLGEKALLEQLVGAALVAALSFGAIGSKSAARELSSVEERAESSFAYNLGLTMLLKSNSLDQLAGSVADAVDLKGEKREEMAQLLKLATLSMMILGAVSSEQLPSVYPLIQSHQSELEKGIDLAAKIVDEGVVSGSLDSEASRSLNVYLHQASISLASSDIDGVIAAMENCFALIGVDTDLLTEELQKWGAVAAAVYGDVAAIEAEDIFSRIDYAV